MLTKLIPRYLRCCRLGYYPGRSIVLSSRGLPSGIKPSENLVQTLQTELQLEKESFSDFTEGQSFIQQSPFTLKESEETTEIILSRKVGNKIIEIKYHGREPQNYEFEDEEKQQENEEKDEEKDEEAGPKSMTNISIIIKNEDGSGTVFQCISSNAALSIISVGYNKNVESLLKFDITKEKPAYIGPNFGGLDERLQNAFYSYLEGLGINEKLLAYIEFSAIEKEQKLYLDWLNKVKEFVAN